jgi:hypothetical protein
MVFIKKKKSKESAVSVFRVGKVRMDTVGLSETLALH